MLGHASTSRQAINNPALPFIPCWHDAQVGHTEHSGLLRPLLSPQMVWGMHLARCPCMLFCIAKRTLSSSELSGTFDGLLCAQTANLPTTSRADGFKQTSL